MQNLIERFLSSNTNKYKSPCGAEEEESEAYAEA